MSLLPVAEAQARLLAMAPALSVEATPAADWSGRWTTAPVTAQRSQPALVLSSMDGYAIRYADMPGPWTVIGESAAGTGFPGTVSAGQAVRIYTGAPMPEGADTIVIQEEVRREQDRLFLSGEGPLRCAAHVRAAGSDFAEGQILIAAGTRMTPRHVALSILGGNGTLPLVRRPRVALLSSGSELVPPGVTAEPGQLPASNAAMLRAMLAALPCAVTDHGIVPDHLPTLIRHFAGLTTADVIVSTGGASVGDHDLIKPALQAAGGVIDFWRIRMRPGKPLICGRLGKSLFIGLPGNPVSAFVTAHLFLMPLVRHLAGCPNPLPVEETAMLGAPMPAVGARDDYVRVIRAADGSVAPLPQQDSAATFALAQADGLALRPAGSPAAQAGEPARFLPF